MIGLGVVLTWLAIVLIGSVVAGVTGWALDALLRKAKHGTTRSVFK